MIGNRIKLLRKEKQWNQTELAKKLGVGRTTITEYERETIVPSYDKILSMAKVFGVSVDYLTGESNSRMGVVEDVNDLAEQLNSLIDQLKNVDIVMKLNGKPMTYEMKVLASDQLHQVVKLLTYMNK